MVGGPAVFAHLEVPDLVAGELASYGLEVSNLGVVGLTVRVVAVAEADWERVLRAPSQAPIQPADAQVVLLARGDHFRALVLTDDFTLRRRLEDEGATAVGSVGILVRAYHGGRITRLQLDDAIDALFTRSTLHLSRAFRGYVRQLLSHLS